MISTSKVDDHSLDKRHFPAFSPLSLSFKTARSLSVKKLSQPQLGIDDTSSLLLKKESGFQGNLFPASGIPNKTLSVIRQKRSVPHLNPCLTKNQSSTTLVSRSSLGDIFTLKQNSLYLKVENDLKNQQRNNEADNNHVFVNNTPFKPVIGSKLENQTLVKSSFSEQQNDASWPLKIRQKSVEMKRKKFRQILFTKNTEEEEIQSQIPSKQNKSHSKSEVSLNLFDDLLARRSSLSHKTISSARNLSPLGHRKKVQDKYSTGLLSHRSSIRIQTEESLSRYRRTTSEVEDGDTECYQKRNNKIASLLKPVQESYKAGPSLLINNKPQLLPLGMTTEKVLILTQENYFERPREAKKEILQPTKRIFTEMNDVKRLLYQKLASKGNL